MTQSQTRQNPVLFRGSLVVLKRRCGKKTCCCTEGQLHETPALSYSVDGVTRMVSLPSGEVPTVKAGLARYRKALEELERTALAGIQALYRRLERERTERRKKR
ncbi:MAG: DUF6788 family protein [Candidatus Methylomirabilales bacterium]